MRALDALYLEDFIGSEDLLDGGSLSLGEVLGEALSDDYAHASPEELDAAVCDVLDSMSPAESLSFSGALRQIQRGTERVLNDPTVARIAATGLPIAGGAVGTVVGGPLGTSLGSRLGTVAANAVAGTRPVSAQAQAPVAAPANRPVANGSTAAAQGLVLTQQPEVLKSLLALALGQHGRGSVAGIDVGGVMNALSKIFEQAAADADELLALRDDGPTDWVDVTEGFYGDSTSPDDRAQALYAALVDAENAYLIEMGDER